MRLEKISLFLCSFFDVLNNALSGEHVFFFTEVLCDHAKRFFKVIQLFLTQTNECSVLHSLHIGFEASFDIAAFFR